jgi:leucyl-tRNA synthetase
MWPKSIYTNGHVLVNNEKMSKSKGNFMTLKVAIEKYSADAMRLALADAGDTNEDANFAEITADRAILRLTTLKEWFETEIFVNLKHMRTGPKDTFADRVFDTEINQCITRADEHFAKMQFKDALRHCFYELCNARDFYRLSSGGAEDPKAYHRDLAIRFTEVFCIIMSPFTPHFSEYIYGKLHSLPEVEMKSSLTAGEYVKKFELQETLEELINAVLKEKPADPYAKIAVRPVDGQPCATFPHRSIALFEKALALTQSDWSWARGCCERSRSRHRR